MRDKYSTKEEGFNYHCAATTEDEEGATITVKRVIKASCHTSAAAIFEVYMGTNHGGHEWTIEVYTEEELKTKKTQDVKIRAA